VAGRLNNGQALLTALAGLSAYETGAPAAELLAMGEEAPAETFVAALAIASALARELERLGGNPDGLRSRIYDKASQLAYT
jgi:hypothetical protein